MSAGKFGARAERNLEPELIARLRGLPEQPRPDPRFAAELRSQLVAIAPRIVAESADEQRRPSPSRHRRPSRGLARVRRPLLAIGGAAAVLVLLLGLAVSLSGSALPGQSLYGLKRASEDFKLSVSGGSDAEKGLQYLKLAHTRVTESAKLVGATTASDAKADLVASTLRTADSETRNGLRLIGKAALDSRSTKPAASIPAWAKGQTTAITALVADLPAGSTGLAQAKASLALLERVRTRVDQWMTDFTKGCLSAARSDDLGPKGC